VSRLVSDAWSRIRVLCSVPFHPQRRAALRLALAAAGREWGVEVMFKGELGAEFVGMLATRKEGFLYEDQAEAQVMRCVCIHVCMYSCMYVCMYVF
jgi:hypothetical protein